MKISIHGQSGYFDKERYTLCGEPLEITIESKTVYSDLYAVCVLNGKRETFKIRNGVLTVPPAFLTQGEMLIDLQQIRNGEIIKRWSVEKLTLCNAESEYEAIPELAALRKDIKTLRTALKEVAALIKKNNQI